MHQMWGILQMKNMIKSIKNILYDKIIHKKQSNFVEVSCYHELVSIIYPKPETIKMWQCIKCGKFYR